MSAVATRLVTASAPSPALGEDIELRVYLPPGYGEDPTARHPVLYLLHGRGGHPDDWAPVVPHLDALVRDGSIPPVLAVLPFAPWSEGASWYVDSAYTGTPAGRPVETALTRDLTAYVDASHPTLADRDHRFVAGYSMGGAGALRLVLAHPETYSAALAMSPAVYAPEPPAESTLRRHGAFGRGTVTFDPQTYAALGHERALERLDPSLPVRLFLAAGDQEGGVPLPADHRHDVEVEAALLHARARRVPGVTSRLRVLAGGHDWPLWTRAFVEGLPFVLGTDRGRTS